MYNELPKAGNLIYNNLNLKTNKMKKYFNWLMVNTKISKASFKMFWTLMYLIFLFIVIHEAIVDSPKALIGLMPVGLMMYHQWREFKSDTKKK